MTALSRPLFKWFGSKWNTAPYYPRPKFDVIADYFCGGLSYPSQYPERKIVLFDINPDLIGLINWLIGVDPEEILALPCESLEIGQDIRDLGLPGMGAELIRRWQRVGNNECWTVSKWGHLPGQWTPSARKSVSENVKRIRHWEAYCVSYDQIDTEIIGEATHFIDAPYQHVKGYRFESIDFGRLTKFACGLRGQVIVCEQEGADWLPFRPFMTIPARCAASRKPGSKSREVIWTNEVPDERQQTLFGDVAR